MPRPALSAIDTTAIQYELRRRASLSSQLAAMRDRLQARVVALDGRIAEWGGSQNGARPRRAPGRPVRRGQRRGGTPLREVLAGALKGKTMTVTEAAAAARASGYKSESKSFYHAVAQVLAQSGRFRRVGRGRYRAR